MNSVSLPEPEADCLEQNCLDGKQSDTSKKSRTARKSSDSELPTVFWMPPLSLETSESSSVKVTPQHIRDWLMCLPQDSPASRSVLPENENKPTTKGICGQQQPTLLGLSNPDSYCLKMCRESVNTCPWLSETCADVGMMFHTPYSLGLTMLAPRTDENECGLWRTPSASEADHGGPNARDSKGGLHLSAQVMWPTPQAENFRGRGGNRKDEMGLDRMVKMWPTPKGSPSGPDFARMNRDGSGGDDLATAIARNFPTPKQRDWKGKTQRGAHAPMDGICNFLDVTGGQLNPDWVEWLMGWPPGWTSLEPMAMEVFKQWENNGSWWAKEPDNIPRVANKISNRVNRLKAIGNGQVPLVVSCAWRILINVITKKEAEMVENEKVVSDLNYYY